jgi:hypothetical protein
VYLVPFMPGGVADGAGAELRQKRGHGVYAGTLGASPAGLVLTVFYFLIRPGFTRV